MPIGELEGLRLTVSYFSADDSGLLRILEENEWRGIGITQSLGWEHFEVHGMYHCILRGPS